MKYFLGTFLSLPLIQVQYVRLTTLAVISMPGNSVTRPTGHSQNDVNSVYRVVKSVNQNVIVHFLGKIQHQVHEEGL